VKQFQHKNRQKGCFITLEGIEGVGKSSSLEFIQNYLQSVAIPLEITREPGGTPIAEAIRRLLLAHHDEKMAVDTELLLLFAGRAQHMATQIRPALEKGYWVVCDRFTDASYAYQGAGRGVPEERIALLETWVQEQLRPNKIILLDAPVELALQRAKARGKPDRFELENQGFFNRVRSCYLERAKRFPEQYCVIDASLTQSQVYAQLQLELDKIIQTLHMQQVEQVQDK
jgi:dTMP kinase